MENWRKIKREQCLFTRLEAILNDTNDRESLDKGLILVVPLPSTAACMLLVLLFGFVCAFYMCLNGRGGVSVK